MLDITEQLEAIEPTELIGSVVSTVGMTISAAGFPAPVGAIAEIQREPDRPLLAEVIGFRDVLTLLLPLSGPFRACCIWTSNANCVVRCLLVKTL